MVTLPELKQVFDNLDEGIVVIDQNRKIVSINQAASRMLGQDRDATINKLCPSIFRGTDCAKNCEKNDHCTLMVETKQERKMQDLVVHRPDGALVQLRMWAIMLPAKEQGDHCAVILRGTDW
ncbi:MAG: PAS domain-containing protein [Sideroxydans sp.]|jgi:PAS domain S-box-containing protein